MEIKTLQHFKSVSAFKFFVKPADDNYLIARWLLISGFHREFFWQASQAVEKYLKAGLILQDISVKNKSHNLGKLYQQHLSAFADLSFKHFEKPNKLNSHIWSNQTVSGYLFQLERLGSPDSRYGLGNWYRSSDDLFKLDQICWHLRRVTIGLDWRPDEDLPCDQKFNGATFRELLLIDPLFEPRQPIEKLSMPLAEVGQTRGDLLHAWNFEYTRSDTDYEKSASQNVAPTFGPIENSYLWLYISEAIGAVKRGLNHHEILVDGLAWLKNMIKLTDYGEIDKLIESSNSATNGANR